MTDSLRDLLFRTVLGGLTVKGEQLTAITEAADTLASKLEDAHGEVTGLALNAFLPDGHLGALHLVHEALTAQWPTFTSEVPDGGLPYLRATAIMALLQHADDDKLGSALYLLLVDPLMRQGDRREAALRKHVLGSLRATYLKASKTAWTSVEVRVPNISVKPPAAVTVLKDAKTAAEASIFKAMQATTLGSYGTGYTTINVQVPDAWATTLSAAVTDAFESLIGQVMAPLASALGAPLKDVAKFSPLLREALEAAKLAERRMDVMWWMQARYSPSLEVPYRTLGPILAAFRMAHDLDDLVPAPAPPEVEAVLLEAWHVLFGEPKPEPLLNVLKTVTTGDPSFESTSTPSAGGRVDVLDALTAAAGNPRLTQKQLFALTGVTGNTPLSGPELALWVFRTYQAQKLLQ